MARPDVIELLAQLDLLILRRKNAWSLQDSNVEEQVEKVLSTLSDQIENQYTPKQIKERLWRKFRQNKEVYPKDNFPRLFLHGSEQMTCLNSHERELVSERLKVIETHTILDTPQGRRLRSFPTTVETTASRRSSRNPSTPARSISRADPRNQRGNSIQRAHRQKKNGLIQKERRAHPASKKRRMQSVAVVIPSIEIAETPSDSRSPSYLARPLAESTPLSVIHVHESPITVSHNSERGSEKGVISSGYQEPRSSSFPHTVSPEHLEDVIAELTHYKHLYEETRQQCKDLEVEIQQKESFYKTTGCLTADMLVELSAKAQHITDLQKKLDSREDLEPYLTLGDPGVQAPTTQLRTGFENMKEAFASIPFITATNYPSINSLYGRSDDLDELLSALFDSGNPSNAFNLSKQSPVVQTHDLVKGLTGAAINCWIFRSKYNPLLTSDTPLLRRYRDYIARLCGNEGLYHFDTAVHQSLVDDQYFQNITIPRTADKHTDRLLNAFQLLLDENVFPEKYKKLKKSLTHIFGLAVQVRSRSLIGFEEYRLIWPSPGSLFDSNTMKTSVASKSDSDNQIRLPLCPGLYAYPKAKGIVGYHPFGNGEVATSRPNYLIKSLVLL